MHKVGEAARITFCRGMEKSPVNIFSFVDFKRYLSEAYAWRSTADERFTKTYICRQMGLPNSRSFFSDIIAGKKLLSKSKMELLIPIFALEGDAPGVVRPDRGDEGGFLG